jgi:hypothetical protein
MGTRIVEADRGSGRTSLLLSLAAGLALGAPAARADTASAAYKTEQVIQSGSGPDGAPIPSSDDLYVGGLSDAGQLIFSAGWLNQGTSERLFAYAGGKFTPIVMPSTGSAGDNTGDVVWPKDITVARPVSVNGSGNVVFSAGRVFGSNPYGTFLWTATSGHTTPVALKDMPATGDLTFVNPGGYAPAINSSNEIALVGQVQNAAKTKSWSLFRLGRDGVLQPVARAHEALTLMTGEGAYVWDTGGSHISIDEYPMPSIDDNGRVAFTAHPDGVGRQNAYLWDQGAVSPILTYGATAPNGGKFTSIRGAFLNSRNAWALVMAATDQAGSSAYGLYRVVNGQSAQVAAPGQTMPGGGTLRTVQYIPTSDESPVPYVGVSAANSLGEHVFLATLSDGTPAAYKIDANGGLSLVMKGDFPSKPVHIQATSPALSFIRGSRPSINKRGQIALSARYAGQPAMIVLLTPSP